MPSEAFPAESELRPLEAHSTSVTLPPLYGQQQEVADAICEAVGSRTHVTASVLGMTCTGKTRLLLEVSDRIASSGRKVILLSPNRRIAESQDDSRFRSIYRHLYLDPAAGEPPGTGEGTAGSEPKKSKGAIELRTCDDPEDCVYLLDDAHLLGNSEFVTPDGCTYGSGKLLSDFFEFTGVPQRQRQMIFFGDPYQIQRASAEDSVLSGSFQEARSVSHRSLNLDLQIYSAPEVARLRNARILVEALDNDDFSSLELVEDNGFRVISAESAAVELAGSFKDGTCSTRLVVEAHAQVSRFVRWLRPRLFGQKSPAPVEPGELVEVYAAYSGTASGTDHEFFAGHRYRVEKIGKRTTVQQHLMGRQERVRFRLIETLTLSTGGAEPGELTRVLEDYVVAEKPELPADVAIALRVWSKSLNSGLVGQADSGDAEEDVATGLPASLVRYGYASTVHHAQGNPVAECYVNGDFSGSLHCDAYFRWLYTALTTSRSSVKRSSTSRRSAAGPTSSSRRWNAR